MVQELTAPTTADTVKAAWREWYVRQDKSLAILDRHAGSGELKVPIAIGPGNVFIGPEQANKDDAYVCADCYEPVVLRAGNIKRAHFAHKADRVCSGETLLHLGCKEIFQMELEAWTQRGKSGLIFVERKLNSDECGEIVDMPAAVASWQSEYRLPTGYIADIALFGDSGKCVCDIEFYISHRVEHEKAMNLGVAMIEVDGYAYLQNMDGRLHLYRHKLLQKAERIDRGWLPVIATTSKLFKSRYLTASELKERRERIERGRQRVKQDIERQEWAINNLLWEVARLQSEVEAVLSAIPLEAHGSEGRRAKAQQYAASSKTLIDMTTRLNDEKADLSRSQRQLSNLNKEIGRV